MPGAEARLCLGRRYTPCLDLCTLEIQRQNLLLFEPAGCRLALGTASAMASVGRGDLWRRWQQQEALAAWCGSPAAFAAGSALLLAGVGSGMVAALGRWYVGLWWVHQSFPRLEREKEQVLEQDHELKFLLTTT